MKVYLAILTGLLLAAFGGRGASSAYGADYATYTGERLYLRFCASCHGEEGYGNGPVSPALSNAVPDLTHIAKRNEGEFPAAKMKRFIDGRRPVIAHGPRIMPVWGTAFWYEEGADEAAEEKVDRILNELVEHLRSIQRD